MTNLESNLWLLLARVEKIIANERPELWESCILEALRKYRQGEEV